MNPVFDLWRESAQQLPRHPTKVWGRRDPGFLNGLVFHQALGHGSVEDVARYHIGPNHMSQEGLPSIAYTFAIRKNGEILMCLDFEEKPWSQGDKNRPGDENAEFVSCMLEGMFHGPGVTDPTAGEPTLDQLVSSLRLWQCLKDHFKWLENALYGHFDFGKPSCPGTTMEAVIRAIRLNGDRFEDSSLTAGNVKPDSVVEKRQGALVKLGYPVTIDGVWGPKSREALYRFQADHGLQADGLWGPKTQEAVDNLI